jgi:glyoxylase-like metal-dependent hydrolase (beta-lactamase superfamily II)
MPWRIFPLDLGDTEGDMSERTLRRGAGKRVREKFIAWYLTDGARRVLVDTGLPDEAYARRWHPYTNPSVAEAQRIENALAAVGVKAAEIELVILTHLHWDHCSDLPRFANAEFVVSKAELQCAIDPCPILWAAYEAPRMGTEPSFLRVLSRLRTIDLAEQEILPGLTIFPTPGHSPGSMSLVVTTAKGPYVIAGDAVVCYENLEGDPAKGLKYIPTGIYTDLFAMWDSMARIHAKALFEKDRVLPGHESRVFRHRCYPPSE